MAFVGAGVSTISPTCLPSWWEVNEQVVAALARNVEPLAGPERSAALARAVRERQQAGRFPPEYQAELLAGRLGESYFRVLQCLDSDRPNAVHLRLAGLAAAERLSAIVTTNFDRALEAALQTVNYSARTCARAAEFEALAPELERGDGRANGCVLLKLHGSAEDAASLIDTLAQRKRGLPRGALDCLRILLGNCHWVFLGWSGADLDADEWYLGLKAGAERARGFTWLCRSTEKARDSVEKIRDAYGERGVIVHGELPDWLAEATAPLLPPDNVRFDTTDLGEHRRLARERVATEAREWAHALGSTRCVLGLSDILSAVGEPQEAVHLLRAALDALPEAERDGREGIMLACALASSLGVMGQDAQALELYQQAIARLEARGDFGVAAEARGNAGLIYRARGDLDAARASFEGVLAVTSQSGDEAKRTVALHNLALIYRDLGQFERAEALFREEIAILHRLGDEPNEAVALNDLGEMLGEASRFDLAVDVLNEALRIRERLGNDRGRAMSLGNLAKVHLGRGDLDSAARIYRDVMRIFARLGDEPGRITAMGNLGVVTVRQGLPDEAVPPLREALSGAEALGREPEMARLLMNLGEALREAGNAAEAYDALGRSVSLWERLGVPSGRAEALLELGVTHLETNRADDAEGVFREVLGIWESLKHEPGIARVLTNLGIVAQQRGNLVDALALFERSNEIYGRLGAEAAVVRGKVNVGNIALQQGRLDEAVVAYAAARGIADRLNLPVESAGARAAIAYALGLQGKVGEALAAFRDAEAHVTGPAGRSGLAQRLEHLAEIYAANGHDQQASVCAEEAARLRDASSDPVSVPMDFAFLRKLAWW